MISLVNKHSEMENNVVPKKDNKREEAAELLGFSSSDSLDSPSFSHFQAPKQKRKVRFKKPFRSVRPSKSGRGGGSQAVRVGGVGCLEGAKIFSLFSLLAVVGALLWYVISLSQRIQELQNKFADIEAGNRNTPEALHLQHSKLKLLESNVTLLYGEVRRNRADIDNITNEVRRLRDVTNDLKESLAAAPALQELPKNVHALSESLVSFGAKMNALESNLKELKDQQGQVAAQNLSGELETLKGVVQELMNASDVQSRSNGSKTALQETNQQVHALEARLLGVVQWVGRLNLSLSDLPSKVETLQEAIAFITNDTRATHSLVSTLENFMDTNLTQRLEQLEANNNRTLENIPKSEVNGTQRVDRTLRDAFDAMIASRDLRMQEMDSEIKHLTSSVLSAAAAQSEAEDPTTPLFVQSDPKRGTTTAVPPEKN